MSVHVSSAVWRLDLPSTEKLVLLKLADCADDTGANAWPSQETIAAECGLSVRQVRRVLSYLMERGLIQREREAAQHRSAMYRVCPERGKDVPSRIERIAASRPDRMSGQRSGRPDNLSALGPGPDRTFQTHQGGQTRAPRPDICDVRPDTVSADPSFRSVNEDPSADPAPPYPPAGGGEELGEEENVVELRAERARRGSRRQRDIQALEDAGGSRYHVGKYGRILADREGRPP